MIIQLMVYIKLNMMRLYLLTLLILLVKYSHATCDLGIYDHGVPIEDQDEVVKAHNDVRLMIARGEVEGQPRGINLKRMKWDDNLAREAQIIADTCEFAHKPVNDDRWPWVGQNLYAWAGTHPNNETKWTSAVNAWFSEHKDIEFGSGTTAGAGHYTQVVWATSDHLGCGYVYFPTGEEKFKHKKIYVCNYGPGGNIVGQNPYETGTSGCENLC